MKELKFRAWLKEKKKMVSVCQINLSNEYIDYIYNGNINRDSFMNIELMQYIGVKDKNGKAVYEGDVVQLFDGNKYIIKWNDQIACFEIVNDFGYLVFASNNDFEVIGNIYENPEWLEIK